MHGRALRSSRSPTFAFCKNKYTQFQMYGCIKYIFKRFYYLQQFPKFKKYYSFEHYIIRQKHTIVIWGGGQNRVCRYQMLCRYQIVWICKIVWRSNSYEYIRSREDLYRSWMTLRFNLKAAVTRPVSGDQISETSVTAWGISNFCSPDLTEWFCISVRVNFSTCGWLQSSSKVFNSMPSKQKCHC